MSVTRASLLGDTFGSSSSGTIPLGGIIMWSGATVPGGWQLCNNTSLPANSPLRPGITNTPDLRDRFIVGSGGALGIGSTGGSADATLVSHTHSTYTDGAHRHAYAFAQGSSGGIGENYNESGINGVTNRGNVAELEQTGGNDGQRLAGFTANTQENGAHTHPISTEGSSSTNANLPPYYALAFIMRVL